MISENRPVAVGDAARSTNDASAFDLHLLDLWGVICRQWMLLSAGMVVCLAAAAAYFVLTPSKYESSASLLVMRRNPGMVSQNPSLQDSESKISEELLATQIEIIQGRDIVAAALKESGLDEAPSILAALEDDDTPTKYVLDNLSVTRGGRGQSKYAHVLDVAFRHSSPSDSQAVVQAVIERYEAFVDETFSDQTSEAETLIGDEVVKREEKLTEAEAEFKEFIQDASVLWSGETVTNIHRQRYEEIQTELSLLAMSINETETRLEVVKEAIAEQRATGREITDLEKLALIDEKNAERVGVMIAVQKGEAETAEFQSRQPERMEHARSEYQALLALRMEEQTLLNDFGPQHPEVVSIRQQIRAAEDFIAGRAIVLGVDQKESFATPTQLLDAYLVLLRRDLDSMKRREAELLKRADVEEREARLLASDEIEGESLRRRVLRQQELFDVVVEQLRDLQLANDNAGLVHETLAAPEFGEEVWPSLPICFLLGAFSGALLGGFMALISELRDRSFSSVEEVRRVLDAPLLSQSPTFTVDELRKAEKAAKEKELVLEPAMLAAHLPLSRFSESIRGLRTSLFYRAKTEGVRVLALTSANSGEGKSTLAANLAVSIAQAGRSVLLVDGDLRRPRMAEIFGLQNKAGLVDVVEGENEPWDAVFSVGVEGLAVMPSGAPPENPAELLSTQQFEDFLRLASDKYDFVLIDCPPLLAVADPCIIGPKADASILVVRLGVSDRVQSARVRDMIREAGSTLLGFVVNASEGKTKGGYGDGYSYGSYGYQGYDSPETAGAKRQRQLSDSREVVDV